MLTLPGFVLSGAMLACTPEPPPKVVPPDPSTPTDTDTTDSETAVPTGQTGTTGTTAATGDTGPEIDCTIVPTIPVPWITTDAFQTSEDFDFDGDGYLCSIVNGRDLTCLDQQGNFKMVAPNVVDWGAAGTRILPTGDWVVADLGRGALVRVDTATGASTVVLGDLAYPNGVEVGRDGWAYVAENSGAKVRQVDPYTGEQYIIADGLVQPNGVILSPDGNTMYVGSFGGGVIYAIDRLGPTEWDEPRVLFNPPVPDGGFDGINVDVCGNVYITEYVKGRVFRITPDGLSAEMVADFQAGWIPNMRWGHDIGGWSSDILYVSDRNQGRLFALDIGLPGKKHVLVP